MPAITDFLGPVDKILFIPFATLTGWNENTEQLAKTLSKYRVTGIHQCLSMVDAIKEAESIVICGGNTFHLLYHLQKHGLIEAIRERVLHDGVPYVGWSAGSNVACPDIKTTNDMPIIWPSTDSALNLFPYNINPHYTQAVVANFCGESRDQRLDECYRVNRRAIVGLPEGCGIRVENDKFQFIRGNFPDLQVKIWKPSKEVDKQFVEFVHIKLTEQSTDQVALNAFE